MEKFAAEQKRFITILREAKLSQSTDAKFQQFMIDIKNKKLVQQGFAEHGFKRPIYKFITIQEARERTNNEVPWVGFLDGKVTEMLAGTLKGDLYDGEWLIAKDGELFFNGFGIYYNSHGQSAGLTYIGQMKNYMCHGKSVSYFITSSDAYINDSYTTSAKNSNGKSFSYVGQMAYDKKTNGLAIYKDGSTQLISKGVFVKNKPVIVVKKAIVQSLEELASDNVDDGDGEIDQYEMQQQQSSSCTSSGAPSHTGNKRVQNPSSTSLSSSNSHSDQNKRHKSSSEHNHSTSTIQQHHNTTSSTATAAERLLPSPPAARVINSSSSSISYAAGHSQPTSSAVQGGIYIKQETNTTPAIPHNSDPYFDARVSELQRLKDLKEQGLISVESWNIMQLKVLDKYPL